jgi:hypothetical protein
MGFFYKRWFNTNSPLPAGTDIGASPRPLLLEGFNFPVAVSTPSGLLKNPSFDKDLAASIVVMAHLDTGASRTSIDIKLAEHLKLVSTGNSSLTTAGGVKIMPDFVVDLNFPNTDLGPFINLPVGSCNLPFDISGNLNDFKNFALLLGRDILSYWNVVWNGPTSTVFIND